MKQSEAGRLAKSLLRIDQEPGLPSRYLSYVCPLGKHFSQGNEAKALRTPTLAAEKGGSLNCHSEPVRYAQDRLCEESTRVIMSW